MCDVYFNRPRQFVQHSKTEAHKEKLKEKRLTDEGSRCVVTYVRSLLFGGNNLHSPLNLHERKKTIKPKNSNKNPISRDLIRFFVVVKCSFLGRERNGLKLQWLRDHADRKFVICVLFGQLQCCVVTSRALPISLLY